MKSATTRSFWRHFEALPDKVQRQAERSFALWRKNARHPSLQFKPVRGVTDVYSARAGLNWRVLGRRRGDTIYWFWIGPHSEYDQILSEHGSSD